MKKATVMPHSASLELPQISKFISESFSYRKTKQVLAASNTFQRPTEELINRLNRLGQEYPFCVYYKEKTNDPL